MKIKKNDTVLIISGKDRGKKGKVLQSLQEEEKIVVEGINIMKKNVRPKQQGKKGQIIEFNAPIHISNAELICPKCSKATRVGYKILERGGNKKRVCKKCGEIID